MARAVPSAMCAAYVVPGLGEDPRQVPGPVDGQRVAVRVAEATAARRCRRRTRPPRSATRSPDGCPRRRTWVVPSSRARITSGHVDLPAAAVRRRRGAGEKDQTYCPSKVTTTGSTKRRRHDDVLVGDERRERAVAGACGLRSDGSRIKSTDRLYLTRRRRCRAHATTRASPGGSARVSSRGVLLGDPPQGEQHRLQQQGADHGVLGRLGAVGLLERADVVLGDQVGRLGVGVEQRLRGGVAECGQRRPVRRPARPGACCCSSSSQSCRASRASTRAAARPRCSARRPRGQAGVRAADGLVPGHGRGRRWPRASGGRPRGACRRPR